MPSGCDTCGKTPARKANIRGLAEYRCAEHEQAARRAEQRDIEEAIAKGATWLRRGAPRLEVELVQRSLFELWEAL